MRIELVEVAECGPFTHRWPEAVERFARGWDLVARVDGELARLRHGLGEREVYGRRRAHSVTFLRGQPVVEGVGADDHERSRALLSLIKGSDGRMVRRVADLPAGYEGLPIVDHAAELRAPYTRRGLAAKVREDDLEVWTRLAILRSRMRGRAGSQRRPRASGGSGAGAPSRETSRALEDLRDRLGLAELEPYLRAYEAITGYDRALEELWAATDGSVNPGDPRHRESLIGWLRRWGCRHLRRQDDARTSEAMLDWWQGCRARLPLPGRSLVDLSEDELEAVGDAFEDLAARVAASRSGRRGDGPVTFGPTAAAKTLFALRPATCIPWDAPIRAGLGAGATYVVFLASSAEALRGLSARVGFPVDELPRELGRPGSSPAKLVDEYLWARVTRKVDPPAGPGSAVSPAWGRRRV